MAPRLLYLGLFYLVCVTHAIRFCFVEAEPDAEDVKTKIDGDVEMKAEVKPEVVKEKHPYQAEVNRLMDIITNSLYTQKPVFLRELIANGADALEKVRLKRMMASDDGEVEPDSELELCIRIESDKDAKTITVTDTGVGMTKDELIDNLGTIAKSGTSNFAEVLAHGNFTDPNLIGQFGVGFYSVYLVADKVTVTSKNVNDDQYVWESSADGTFSIYKDPDGNTLQRGTKITLHLKGDAANFLNPSELKNLAINYGKFLNHRIYVKVEKTIKEDVPEEEVGKEDKDDVEVKEEEEKKEKKKVKQVEKKVLEFEHVNPAKAIWLRPKGEISEEEYKEFYKAISKDYSDPLAYSHFTAEGEFDFKSIIYIPKRAPMDMFDNYFQAQQGIKLYVRSVLVGDKFEELVPRYLRFLKGVVSSDQLPLNVSREQLQQNFFIAVMSKKIVKKTLEMIKRLAEDSENNKKKLQASLEEETDEDKKKELAKLLDEPSDFDVFWKEYSRSMKIGCYEDDINRSKIAKILRFYSSKSPSKTISLSDYVKNARDVQKVIYYLSGENSEQLMKSPHMQIFLKKDIEVLFLTEAMSESCVQKLTDFEGKTFVAIAKGDADIDETEQEKQRFKKLKKVYDPLLRWLEKELRSKVQKVELSKRLVSDPCLVVSSQWGYSAHMEKMMKSQTFADPTQIQMMANQKILEINPDHPAVFDLLKKIKANKDDETAKSAVRRLFAGAMVASGFDPDDPREIAHIVYEHVNTQMNIDPKAEVKEIDISEFEEEEKADDEVADDANEDIDADDDRAEDDENHKDEEKENEEDKEAEVKTEEASDDAQKAEGKKEKDEL